MPGILYRPINRKQFLKMSFGVAATLSVPTYGWSHRPAKEAHWAFLSDTHVASNPTETYRDFRPYENLQTVVPQVQAAAPQGVIINGDVARLSGEAVDYQLVTKLLDPLAQNLPVHMTMGNHDDRENFYRAFPTAKTLVEEKYVHVIEASPIRMILLDSLLYVNKVTGLLGKMQRSWLEMFLDSADEVPTLILVHHSHRYHYGQRDGIHLVNLPAVGYNFSDEEPVGWLDARLTGTGGDFTLRAFGGNQTNDRQTTHLDWRQ